MAFTGKITFYKCNESGRGRERSKKNNTANLFPPLNNDFLFISLLILFFIPPLIPLPLFSSVPSFFSLLIFFFFRLVR